MEAAALQALGKCYGANEKVICWIAQCVCLRLCPQGREWVRAHVLRPVKVLAVAPYL